MVGRNKRIRYGAGITIYNPSYENLQQILSYIDVFDNVIVFDNSDKINKEDVENKLGVKGIIYISEGENKGLPYAFNKMIDISRTLNCDFLCTLDQDSIFNSSEISKIKEFVENYIELMENVGIVAPFIDYSGNDIPHKKKILKKNWVILSGSFLNLDIISKYNLRYDENYFIDKFEIDLCKQMTEKEIEIYMYTDSILRQKLGQKSRYKHPNHSALRQYYIFRNRLYFNYKYYTFFRRWILNILQTVRHILMILMYENKKNEKISTFFIAFKDYSKGKFGKYSGNRLY